MTLISRIMSLFPLAHMAALIACLWMTVASLNPFWLVAFFALLYLLPPLLWRVYRRFFGQNKHIWVLNRRERCDWWIAHQFQIIYAVFPSLEAVLRVIPGAYSAWLRLWGSKVGKGIYWTPEVELLDRHNLTLGDRIVFGHKATLTCHIIVKKHSGLMVLIERGIRIGDDCFIGADARLSPGVTLPPATHIPYRAEIRFRYNA